MVRVRDVRGREHDVSVPRTDIDAFVGRSYRRSACYVIGLLLVLTDVPRTGLRTSVPRRYERVAPGTVMYYGPYDYAMAHMVRASANSSVSATCDGERLETFDVWSYKFDSLSIAPRAMATHLQLDAFPECLLYKAPCRSSTLPLETVFRMLDDLVSAMHARFFLADDRRGQDDAGHEPPSVAVLTSSHWIDRLHHHIVRPLWRSTERRLHTFHYFAAASANASLSLRMCAPARRRRRPLLCSHPVPWTVAPPNDGGEHQEAPRIKVWDHVRLRVDALQRQYPSLSLDVLLTSTQILADNRRLLGIPTAEALIDNVEMTTLVRGRECSSTPCTTVFLDEYRYERASFETDVYDWHGATTVLRALAQLYVWTRVALLLWSCFAARRAERRLRATFAITSMLRCWWTALRTLTLVPSHVVIYTNWLAVSAYAVAYCIDGSIVHVLGDVTWFTLDGFVRFVWITFVLVASAQMRNIWLMALVCKLFLVARAWGVSQRVLGAWTPAHGVLGLRGLFISTASALSLFGFYPSARFRDTDVVSVAVLPPAAARRITFRAQWMAKLELGLRLDVKIVFITSVFFALLLVASRVMQRLATSRVGGFFTCHSFYVPFSAGTLWSATALDIFWFLPLRQPTPRRRLSRKPTEEPPTDTRCDCREPPSLLLWRAVQGCAEHEPLVALENRTSRHWTIVRFMNIVFLSEPTVFLRVRVIGSDLALYRLDCPATSDGAPDDGSSCTIVLLPLRACGRFEPLERQRVVGVVSSTDIQWSHMTLCG
ncbi:hypothetical protein PINS_up010521 [Pythium insidiosum]|nr:hypothetical protein PINS_up010521 [Pythium insidiosum]